MPAFLSCLGLYYIFAGLIPYRLSDPHRAAPGWWHILSPLFDGDVVLFQYFLFVIQYLLLFLIGLTFARVFLRYYKVRSLPRWAGFLALAVCLTLIAVPILLTARTYFPFGPRELFFVIGRYPRVFRLPPFLLLGAGVYTAWFTFSKKHR